MAPALDILIDLHWLETTVLASVRMAAFIVIAPPFSDRAFPGMVKAALSLGLGLAVSPQLVTATPALSDTQFLIDLFLEALVGAAFGFLVYLVFAAVQGAGSLIDLTSGFQLAAAYDPQLAINGAQFTRLFQMGALALLFSSGAYQLILGGLAGTFRALPIGHGLPAGITAQLVAQHMTAMFAAVAQIAGPLIIVLFLADLGLGLLTKVAPALNAFSLSYPVKILLTLALGGGVFIALPAAVQSLTGGAVNVLMGRG
ncbi:type III secretion system export apparatus subunit SctT [Gryllotalpicola kribbensis]|uniref:Type III secretion system export apparatus subunit SctT n=1 Tax=Gryllotalpicola kribbensis TaxID=993084 RepID=A0ABP8AKQ4_9MICO